MRISVPPFEAAPGTAPAYGRQIAFLLTEALKTLDDVEVVDAEATDAAISGTVTLDDELSLEVTVKSGEHVHHHLHARPTSEALDAVKELLADLPQVLGLAVTDEYRRASTDLGTDDSEAFLDLLPGWDVLAQVLREGRDVPEDLDLAGAFDFLVSSLRRDPDFLGPFEALIALARQCGGLGIGDPAMVERSVQAATVLCPDDWRGWYMLGDVYQRTRRPADAQAAYEKALSINAGEAAVWVRVGLMQMAQEKVGEAERSFREALGREDDSEEKTAAPYLASLLVHQGRPQEALHLWEELRDRGRTVTSNWLNLAAAQENAGDNEGARHTFDEAMEALDDKTPIRRGYAAFLMRQQDFAGALRLYEAVVPYMPYDGQVLVEYAQCLQANGQTDEMIKVLAQILDTSPPPDIRSQVVAWKMEAEQPQRLERFLALGKQLMEGDKATALSEMEQLAVWLGDYWKIWLAMAHGYNEIGESGKAEQAALRLIGMFPGCEPAYGELAGALFRQGKAEEAYQGLRQAFHVYPKYVTIVGNLGMAAKFTGRYDEARQIRDALRPLAEKNPGLQGLIEALSEGPQTGPPQ